jgi:V/A-type H+/Na+-transporting ATPase subunit K
MNIGDLAFSAAFCLSALGSSFGIGVAGMAANGAWKKCYALNKKASFLLVVFIGAPLTQTIYGMILMNAIKGWLTAHPDPSLGILGLGIFGGLSIGISAYWQGMVAATGADALAETGKGFGNYMMGIGITESVAIFTLVFLLAILPMV